MTYPCLLPRYNLRISKSGFALCDLRLDKGYALSPQEMSIFNMMDGSRKLEEILSFAEDKESVKSLLKAHEDKFVFYKNPHEPAPHLESLAKQMRYRTGNWKYSAAREETPFNVTLNLTSACNYRCLYCFQGDVHTGEHNLPTSVWNNFIAQCAAMGVQTLVVSGGEPVLYPGFFDVLNKAMMCGIYCRILTNGSLLDKSTIKKLADNNIDYVHLSLPAASETIYNRVTRSTGNLSKAVSAIKELKANGIYVKVKMVLTPYNLCDTENTIKICADNGADELFLAPFIPTRKGEEGNMISGEDILKTAEIADTYINKHHDTIRLDYLKSDMFHWKGYEEINKCGTCKDNLTVQPNGDVGFCAPLSEMGKFIFGNIAKDNLEDIWNSPLPDEPDTPVNVQEPCLSCEHFGFCKSGCLLFSFLKNGELWGVDPRCFKSAY